MTGLPFIPGDINTAAAAAFAVDVDAYRIYARGTENGSNALAAEDTVATRASNNWLDEQIAVRYRLQETGGVSGAATDDYKLQYRLNAGSWTDVTGASSVVQAFVNAILSANDGDATTQRLTAGTGSYIAGIVEESDGEVSNFQLTANNHTELVFGLRIQPGDVVDTDVIQFRLLLNGGTTGITNSVTPQVTIKDIQIVQDAFRFYDEDGGEAASTALAAENTDVVINSTTNPDFQYRIRLQETNGQSGSEDSGNDAWRFRVSVNGGAFGNAGSAVEVTNNASSALVDGGATTQRLSNGTGSFFAGLQEESSFGATAHLKHEANNYTEYVWAVSLVDAQLSNNDTLDFRAERLVAGVLDNTGVTYTQIGRVTVSK